MATPEPGLGLMQQVRAGFVLQGTTFSAWCKANQISQYNARDAVIGSWNGPKGKALRAQIVKASGMQRMVAA